MSNITYMKLVKAVDTELVDDIADYDGDDSELLQHYVTAGNTGNYCEVYANANALDIVEHKTVATVLVMGGTAEVRCYSNEVDAVVDSTGAVWMDANRHDDVFC